MEKIDFLFKSQFNIPNIAVPNIVAVFLIWSYEGIYILYYILFCIIVNYVLLSLLYYIFYFYEDRVVRVFVFRPFYRKKEFYYEQFRSVTFQHIALPKGDWAKFNILLKPNKRWKFFVTFTFRKRAKRIEVTEFLLSKGIEMFVLSSFRKKDQEIIDLVRAKYPKNLSLDIV